MSRSTLLRSLPVMLLGTILGGLAVLWAGPHGGPPAPAAHAAAPGQDVASLAALRAQVDTLQADVETLKAKAPDQAHAMISAAYNFTNLWFAAHEKNWTLAQFYLNETKSHLHWAVRIIPVRKDNQGREIILAEILDAVENSALSRIQKSIDAQDTRSFEESYVFTLHDGCYSCHKAVDKPYLRLHPPVRAAEAVIEFVPENREKQSRVESPAPSPNTDSAKPQSMLIEPADLQERLGEPKLRILDTRSKDAYAAGHIPGAVRVDVRNWQNLGRTKNGFHNAQAWAEKVGALGINNESHVVVYGSALSDTARIWWTLKYLGLDDVTLTDGGWEAWVKENRPTETAAPKIAAASFKPKFQPDRLEEIDTLKQLLPSGKLKVVDTRSTDEFTGKEVRGKRGGHIAGATHLEWKELLAADGRVKTPEQLKELFRQRGILPAETAVCY